MDQLFFFNFSGRNLPDYSRNDFNTMHVLNGTIIKTGYELPFPTTGNVKAVDLKGATVFAGFSDAHVHFTHTGISLLGCDLEYARSISEVLEKLSEEARKQSIVLAFNLQEQALRENRLPTSDELDRVSKTKIIWAARKDLHSAVLNHAGLKWAQQVFPGISHKNGFICGHDYNVLSYLIVRQIPDEMLKEGFEETAQQCFRKGVVFVHALEGSTDSTREPSLVAKFFKESDLDGVIYHQSTDPSFAEKNDWPGFGGCLLVDGSFGTRTAALNQPYSDAPETSGNLYMNPEEIESLLKKGRESRLQLALHAIGDRAIDQVASCYLWAKDKYRIQLLPDRIEHFILPTSKAIRAARESGCFVCIQPVFDLLWGGPGGLYQQRLGAERASGCNPFKTLHDLGIPLAGGSDSPVTPIDPILGIHAMVNHNNPDEQMGLNSALAAYIIEPFRFIDKTKTRGHLKTGYKADFVCLSEDPFMVPPSSLRRVRVLQTYINGKLVG